MRPIREIRKQHGLKQSYVAERLGISRQTLARYENNQDKLTIGQAKAICAVLGCGIEDIFLPNEVN